MRALPPFIGALFSGRPNLPIRVWLTLWYITLLAGILLALCGFLYLSLSHSLRSEQDALLAATAAQLQASVDNENGLPRLGEDVKQLSPDIAAALYDSSGRALLDGVPPWPAPALEVPSSRAARAAASFRSVRLRNGEEWRVLTEPIQENGQTIGTLQVGIPLRELEGTLRRLLLLMAIAVPTTLVFAGGGGVFLAHRALSPIDRITRIARRIEAEDLSQRIGLPPSSDEVGRLAETFDTMLERLDRAFRRQRQFAADASHELRTPLAVITAQVDVALEHPRRMAEYREALQVVRVEAERMRDLVSELLTLARADSGQAPLSRERVSLGELAGEVTGHLRPLAAAKGLHLELIRTDPVVVIGDQTRLLQLLLNLTDNALKYTPAGGRVTITVGRRAGWATLTVADTGIGIAPEHLPHLFERFYRVDKARSRAEGGSGLGLSICDWIARAHGGRIEVVSVPGRGSTFTACLPLPTNL